MQCGGKVMWLVSMKIKKKLQSRSNIIFFILFIIFCYIAFKRKKKSSVVFNKDYMVTKPTRDVERVKFCEIPNLDPFAKETVQFFNKYIPKIVCEGQDWVKCYFSECKVIPEILKKQKNITCTYNDIIYKNDHKYQFGPVSIVKNDETYILKKSDHVKVSCVATESNAKTKSKWNGYAAGIRTSVNRRLVPPGREEMYNVLIIGYDSTSKNGFIRRMPKSYKFLTKTMKGTFLNGYNTLGDKPPAMLPILTGKTHKELPEVRKFKVNTKTYLDFFPFMFYNLRKYGYRTAYFQDLSWIGSIIYRYNGFRRQPTDHYLRAFLIEERNGNWFRRLKNGYCLGDTPQSKFMMNITDQFLHLDGKKFVFTFLSDITREDFNIISTTDEDLVILLKSLYNSGVLDNTLVIIMGDHTRKNAHFENTFQGKLEEQLPLMCIVLPEKLKRRRPDAQYALELNAEALTTPYDIHSTILDALDMVQDMNMYKVPGANVRRSLSLLQPIPRTRSCRDADIDPNWCICYVWKNLSLEDFMFRKATEALVSYINTLIEPMSEFCVLRTVTDIIWVMQQRLGVTEIKHEDYSSVIGKSVQFTRENYHLKLVLGPGTAVYEAFLKYIVEDERFIFDSTDITRVNAYGNDSTCIERLRHVQHLKQYCYCIDD